jgi:hypothetical protein
VRGENGGAETRIIRNIEAFIQTLELYAQEQTGSRFVLLVAA